MAGQVNTQGAQSSADMQQMMGEMRAQNAEQMRNNLEMGRMSQQASMSEALGKKFKASGDSVKGLV